MDGADSTKCEEQVSMAKHRPTVTTRSKTVKASKLTGKITSKKSSVRTVPPRINTTTQTKKSVVMRGRKPAVRKVPEIELTGEENAARLLKRLLPAALKDLLQPADVGSNTSEPNQSQTQSPRADTKADTATQQQPGFELPQNLADEKTNQAPIEGEKSTRNSHEVAVTSASLLESANQPKSEGPLDYSIASERHHAELISNAENLGSRNSSASARGYKPHTYTPIPLQQGSVHSTDLRKEEPARSVPLSSTVTLQEPRQQTTELLTPSEGSPREAPSNMPIIPTQQYAIGYQQRIVESYTPLQQRGFFQGYAPRPYVPEWGRISNTGPLGQNYSTAPVNRQVSLGGFPAAATANSMMQSLMYIPRMNPAAIQILDQRPAFYPPTAFRGEQTISEPENYLPQQSRGSRELLPLNEPDQTQRQLEEKKQKNRARNAKRRYKQYQNMMGQAKEELLEEMQARTTSPALTTPQGFYPRPALEPRAPMYSPDLMQNFNNVPLGYPSWLPPRPFP